MKLLCCDGGGAFGIVQATILSRTSDLNKYDVIGGTSIGSVVGAMIASCDSKVQSNMVQFFYTWVPKIFSGYSWRKYNIFTPRYPDTELINALKSIFPTQKFKDLKVPMFVTAVDLSLRKLKVFYSKDPIDGEIMLWEVLRSAVAAETYFLPWKGMADGGIFANNPVMVTVAGAQKELGINSEEMEICSIGTGSNAFSPVGSTNYWSKLAWGLYLIDATLAGSASSMHEYFAQQMCPKKYLRCQFIRENGWNMDDPDIMEKALTTWKEEINDAVKKVEEF